MSGLRFSLHMVSAGRRGRRKASELTVASSDVLNAEKEGPANAGE